MKRNFTILKSFKAFALLSICFLMGSPVFGQTYCAPTFPLGCIFNNNVSNVTMGYINNSYNGCAVTDFTNMVDTVLISVPRLLSITTDGYTGPGAYVDLDNNGDFNGPNEFFFIGVYTGAYARTDTVMITIPPGTTPGAHRMRILATWGHMPDSGDACASVTNYGSYQDYTLWVECPLTLTMPVIKDTICSGSNITLVGSPYPAGLFSYQWIKNGVTLADTTSTLVIPSFSASDAGNYTTIVTVPGCGTYTIPIDTLAYAAPPPAVITPAGSTIFCPGSSVILNANTDPGLTYQWTKNGINITGATGASYNATDTGLFNVTIQNGCQAMANATPVTFYVVPAPVLTPSGLVKICIGTTKTIVDNSVPGETYKWVKDGNIIPGATSPTYIVSTTGSYTIIATDIHTCSDTAAPANVLISPPPPVNVAANGDNTILCQGATLQLNASSTDTGEAYQWQMAGSDIPGATGPVYMAAAAGNYSVVGFNGCYVTSSTITLTANPFPDVIVGGPLTFCSGSSVSLQSSITGTTGLTYQWMKDGSAIDGATGTTYTATTSGTYAIVVTSDNICAGTSTLVTVTANPLPQPIVTSNANHDLTTTLAYASYQWYMMSGGTGTPISNANAYSYTAMANGSYYVAVTDDNGCTGQSGNFVVSDITRLGISNISEALKIYPNPASSYVHIASPVPVNVYVSAMDGRVVLQQNNAVNMDISGLADGVYMMRITDADGNQLKVEKLVKQAR